jgi:hypothetical protein
MKKLSHRDTLTYFAAVKFFHETVCESTLNSAYGSTESTSLGHLGDASLIEPILFEWYIIKKYSKILC